jgi:uncharacterized UBP type Zn finger protein
MPDSTRYKVVGDADGNPAQTNCAHVGQLHPVVPSADHACEDCLREGTRWVHLRMCLECGHMGCCDSSPRQHATAHWHSTQHPVIRSAEQGEEWAWCYADSLVLAPVAG